MEQGQTMWSAGLCVSPTDPKSNTMSALGCAVCVTDNVGNMLALSTPSIYVSLCLK